MRNLNGILAAMTAGTATSIGVLQSKLIFEKLSTFEKRENTILLNRFTRNAYAFLRSNVLVRATASTKKLEKRLR
jgi:hypothetical protein